MNPEVAISYIMDIDSNCNVDRDVTQEKDKLYPHQPDPHKKRKFLKKLDADSAEIGIKDFEAQSANSGGILLLSLLSSIVIIAQTTEWFPAISKLFSAPVDSVWYFLGALAGGGCLMAAPYFRRLISIVFFAVFVSILLPLTSYLFDLFGANPGITSNALAVIAGFFLAMPSYFSFKSLDQEHAKSKTLI